MRRARSIALLALGFAACQPNRPTSSGAPDSRPQATLHGVRMRIYRGDELAMVGRAARLTFNRSTHEVTAEESLLTFHPLSQPVEVRAPRLRGNLDARGADLTGGVRLKGPEGMTGETPSAHFDGPSMVATGDQKISLRGPSYAVQSTAFRLDFAEESFDFDGDVDTGLRGPKP